MIAFMISIGAKVNRARESRRPAWSQADLAAMAGVSKHKIAAWEVDRSAPKEGDLRKVAQALGIALEWFYDGLDTEPMPAMMAEAKPKETPEVGDPKTLYSFGFRKIKYAGIVPCGEWGDPLQSEEMVEIGAELEDPKRFLTKVAGDSCFPALRQGDQAVWHYDLAPASGLIVLAQRKGDHGCTVKQLRTDEAGRPHLHPINPAYEEPADGDGWGVIARLVAVIRESRARHTIYLAAGLRPEDLE